MRSIPLMSILCVSAQLTSTWKRSMKSFPNFYHHSIHNEGWTLWPKLAWNSSGWGINPYVSLQGALTTTHPWLPTKAHVSTLTCIRRNIPWKSHILNFLQTSISPLTTSQWCTIEQAIEVDDNKDSKYSNTKHMAIPSLGHGYQCSPCLAYMKDTQMHLVNLVMVHSTTQHWIQYPITIPQHMYISYAFHAYKPSPKSFHHLH